MKKRKRLKIKLSNRWLYTFIVIGILAIVGVGVWAASYSASGAGHPYTEISTCSNGQILKMSGGKWTCGSDNYVANTDYCSGGSCSGTLILPSSPSGNYAGQINSAGTVMFSNGGAAQGIYAKQVSISDSWADNNANTQPNGLYVKGNAKIGGILTASYVIAAGSAVTPGGTCSIWGEIARCMEGSGWSATGHVCVCAQTNTGSAYTWRKIA